MSINGCHFVSLFMSYAYESIDFTGFVEYPTIPTQ